MPERSPRRRRFLLRLLLAGLLVAVAFAFWQSELPLYLGLEPRRSITLPKLIRITGWQELRNARLLHGEDRPWHFHTVIAELEMPEADAMALLRRFKQRYEAEHILDGGPLAVQDVSRPPRWWKPTSISRAHTMDFLTEPESSPESSSEPVWYGLSIAARSGGRARVFLLWDQR